MYIYKVKFLKKWPKIIDHFDSSFNSLIQKPKKTYSALSKSEAFLSQITEQMQCAKLNSQNYFFNLFHSIATPVKDAS